MLAKAATCRPDVLVPDMEDSVPDGEKGAARETIAEWLPRLGAQRALLIPRVNSIRTDWFAADVAAIVGSDIWGISIGKIDSAADVCVVSDALAHAERQRGLQVGSLRLVLWIESALGIVNCHQICTASDRIAAVAFGGEDYTADLGIERLDDESNVVYARSAICTAASAAGVLALDTPYFQFRNEQGLQASCIAAKRMGFKGRFAIHPAQIETINACFSPADSEIEHARRVIAAFEEAERHGRGSTSLDGRVIDVPVVKRARALLARTDTAE